MPVPNWVMLEPFVLRRDDDESFPDDTKAPIRASGTTSLGFRFRIAFSLVEPPRISRLYAHLPGFPGRFKCTPLAIVATHRHLALFRVAHHEPLVQDFFIYSAADEHPSSSSPSLKALPPCTQPKFDYSRGDFRLPRRRPPAASSQADRRLLTVQSMGLLCRGEDEFVVAELNLYRPSRSLVFADICLFRSCPSADAPGDQPGGEWKSKRVKVLCSDNTDDSWQPYCWATNAVIPFRQWLCWIDYCRGILFCDAFKEPTPTVSFLRFPLDRLPSNSNPGTFDYLYRGVSVVGHELKFVNVDRHDGVPFGTLKRNNGFTITYHTLLMTGGGGGSEWKLEYKVTSDELWGANPPSLLPHDILMYPQVDIGRPHVVHFLFSEWKWVNKKMWVASIDMNTKIVESFSLYINGRDGLETDDADLIEMKSMAPRPFLSCEFPKFLHLSRKRKDME